MDIRNELEQLRDEKYREFGLSLLPNVDKSKMIGVRLPQLRAVAARIKKESPKGVMPDLPQGDMFEEKLVRGFVIASADLPFEEHLKAVADFVPEIDNWSVCDSFVNSLKFSKKAGSGSGSFYSRISIPISPMTSALRSFRRSIISRTMNTPPVPSKSLMR